jgi:pterin-4a-carbinolamine dehydratase
MARGLRGVRCSAATAKRLSSSDVATHVSEARGWKLDGGKLVQSYSFDEPSGAIGFASRVGRLAVSQQHYPDLSIRGTKVEVVLWTRAVHGLSLNDFILAAKIHWAAGYR